MVSCCILVCRHFHKEVAQALELEGLQDAVLAMLPPQCDRATLRYETLMTLLPKDLPHDLPVHVLGGGCLLGCAAPASERDRIHLHLSHQCQTLLAGETLCTSLVARGAYILTGGWLAHWREHMHAWGFQGHLAREFFQESARSLVLLDSGCHPTSGQWLHEMGDTLGLPVERIDTGLDHLRLRLRSLVLEARCASLTAQLKPCKEAQQALAAYGMALDLFANLPGLLSEAEVLDHIREACQMLFAARGWAYLPRDESGMQRMLSEGLTPEEVAALVPQLQTLCVRYQAWEGEEGFSVQLPFQGRTMGVLHLRAFTHPGFFKQYVNTCIGLAGFFGGVIALAQAQDTIAHMNVELEQRVETRTRQLKLANEDLEQFAYMISHELRAPLARIEGFGHLVQELLEVDGNQEAKDHLGRMLVAEVRARTVIDGLLSLTRIALEPIHKEMLHLDEMAKSWWDRYAAQAVLPVDAFASETGLRVLGDKGLVQRLLEEVLNNAFRFHRPHAVPRVRLGRETQDETSVFFVEDNGIGFDMAFSHGITQPFFRMHPESAYPGTGLGLAIARKIVERHQGWIRLESTPDHGTRVRFSLGVPP